MGTQTANMEITLDCNSKNSPFLSNILNQLLKSKKTKTKNLLIELSYFAGRSESKFRSQFKEHP